MSNKPPSDITYDGLFPESRRRAGFVSRKRQKGSQLLFVLKS